MKLEKVIPTISERDDEAELTLESLKTSYRNIIGILYKTKDVEEILRITKDWSLVEGKTLIESNSISELYKKEIKKILEARDFKIAERKCEQVKYKQKDNRFTNYFRNFKFFYDEFQNYDSIKIKNFAKNFLNKCQIIRIKSWNLEQAITMFNSLNATGMPLSDADIISAQMYSKVKEKSLNENKFNNDWNSLKDKASKLQDKKIVDVDQILQQYMYIVRAQLGDSDSSTIALRRFYTYKQVKKDEVENAVINEIFLIDQAIETCDNLNKIADIWINIQDYSIVKLLLKFNENIKLYLISYLYRYSLEAITESMVKEIAECLMRLFAILEIVDTPYSHADFKAWLFNENIKLIDENVKCSEIIDDFQEHINNNKQWNAQNLKDQLLEYDENRLVYLNEFLFDKERNKDFVIHEKLDIEQ